MVISPTLQWVTGPDADCRPRVPSRNALGQPGSNYSPYEITVPHAK